MHEAIEKLNKILAIKNDIKEVLLEKGIPVPSGTPYAAYSELIRDNLFAGEEENSPSEPDTSD
jgi:hypothetical protein